MHLEAELKQVRKRERPCHHGCPPHCVCPKWIFCFIAWCMLAVQVHTVAELERVLKLDLSGAMLGINNRDLGTFKVDLHNNKVIMDSAAGQEVCLPLRSVDLI